MPDVSPGQRKRISRIKRRAIPAVREAYEKGLISARRADDLLYLPKRQQARELAAILADRESRERTAHLAVETINSYLASHTGKVDLMELGQRIRAAIA
jgi:hypothetical protein